MAGAVESNRLRPLGVGELLDAAIKVCTAHAGVLLRAVLVVILPVQILSAIILASTVSDPDYLNITTTELGSDDTAAFWAGQGLVVLLGIVSYLLATGACFHAIAEGWLGRQPSWRESLRFATRRSHSLLWISVLYGIAVGVGFLFCIAPGVWLGVAWSVAFPVLFVEDMRGSKALGRSFELVKGRWWPVCGVVVLGFVLAMIVSSIFTYGLGALALVNDSLGFLILLTTLGGLLSSLLTTPFQAAIISVVYFDLRVRKEGFDLELLAARLAGGAPLPRGQAAPYATPPGVAEWGAPHPAAPYWPPPPGWTPPEGGPAPAATSGGWQPPGAAPAASPSAPPPGAQAPAPTAATSGAHGPPSPGSVSGSGGWQTPGRASPAPSETAGSGDWQPPGEARPADAATSGSQASPPPTAIPGSGGWQIPAGASPAETTGSAPVPSPPPPDGSEGAPVAPAPAGSEAAPVAPAPAEPAPSGGAVRSGDPLGDGDAGETDAFGRRHDEEDAAQRAFGEGDKPSGGSRWLPPRSDDA